MNINSTNNSPTQLTSPTTNNLLNSSSSTNNSSYNNFPNASPTDFNTITNNITPPANNVNMVHGIIVNQPPPSFLAKHSYSPSTTPARNVAVVRSVSTTLPLTPPLLSPNNSDSSNNNSPSLSPIQPILDVEKVTTENERLKTQVLSLEDSYAKLQAALAEKDRQISIMQNRNQQLHSKVKVLSGCKLIPQV